MAQKAGRSIVVDKAARIEKQGRTTKEKAQKDREKRQNDLKESRRVVLGQKGMELPELRDRTLIDGRKEVIEALEKNGLKSVADKLREGQRRKPGQEVTAGEIFDAHLRRIQQNGSVSEIVSGLMKETVEIINASKGQGEQGAQNARNAADALRDLSSHFDAILTYELGKAKGNTGAVMNYMPSTFKPGKGLIDLVNEYTQNPEVYATWVRWNATSAANYWNVLRADFFEAQKQIRKGRLKEDSIFTGAEYNWRDLHIQSVKQQIKDNFASNLIGRSAESEAEIAQLANRYEDAYYQAARSKGKSETEARAKAKGKARARAIEELAEKKAQEIIDQLIANGCLFG
jgi:hypothetical protein